MDYQEALDFLWTMGQGGAAKSSGERVCAGIILSLYNGSDFPFMLDDLGKLSGEWREAANTVIAGWQCDDIKAYFCRKYGRAAWDRFCEENKYRSARHR